MSAPYFPADRRPMAFRNWPPMAALVTFLARRGVSPNAISIAGMIGSMVAGALFALTFRAEPDSWGRVFWGAGAALVLSRGLANLLDGMVAIEARRASRAGELFNDVPDRVSDVAMLLGLGYAAGGWPLTGWIAACAALMCAYARQTGKAAGASADFGGWMSKPWRNALIAAVAATLAALPAESAPRLVFSGNEFGLPSAALIVIAVGATHTTIGRLRRTTRRLEEMSQ